MEKNTEARQLFWSIVEGSPGEAQDYSYWRLKERRFLDALKGLYSLPVTTGDESDLRTQILADSRNYFSSTCSDGLLGPLSWTNTSKLRFLAENGMLPEFWERVLNDDTWWNRSPEFLRKGIGEKGEPKYD